MTEDRRPGRRVFDPQLITDATADLHAALDAAGFADSVEGWVDGQSRAIAERLVRAGWIHPGGYQDELLRLRDQVDRARDIRNRAVNSSRILDEFAATIEDSEVGRIRTGQGVSLSDQAQEARAGAAHALNPPMMSGPMTLDVTARRPDRRCESTINGEQCLLNEHPPDVDHQTETRRARPSALDQIAPLGQESPGA